MEKRILQEKEASVIVNKSQRRFQLHTREARELLGHKGVFTLMSQRLCQGIGLDFSW